MVKLRNALAALGCLLGCTAPRAQWMPQAPLWLSPQATEWQRANQLQQLGGARWLGQGVAGHGVVVAVLDTGLNRQVADFAGWSRVLTGFNALDGSSNVQDESGHGTQVASLVAAPANGAGVVGVAPWATLLPIKVVQGDLASSAAVTAGLQAAQRAGARVVNMSLAATGPTATQALKELAATDRTVVVVAAGNQGQAEVAWPARHAASAWAQGTLLVVGAVDASRQLADFSNRAGEVANHYLVAPGVGIVGAGAGGTLTLSGTSQATPAVSGAAALLLSKWPYLRASQVGAILLQTADDLGAPGVDAVYGHGMLNIDRALSPVGSFTYRTARGMSVTVPLNSGRVLSSQPRVASPQAFQGLITQVFDEHGRNFTRDEGQALAARTRLRLDALLGQDGLLGELSLRPLGAGLQAWSYQAQARPPDSAMALWGRADAFTPQARAPVAQFHAWQWSSGWQLAVGDGGTASMALGAGSLGGIGSPGQPSWAPLEWQSWLASPLIGLSPRHRLSAIGVPLGQGWQVRSAWLNPQADDSQARGRLQATELHHQGPHHRLNLNFSVLDEHGFLGGYSREPLGLNQQTRTVGVTLAGAWQLDTHWALGLQWTRADSPAPASHGLLLASTRLLADGHAVGLMRRDTWAPGDRLSLTHQAPLRASQGSLTYQVIDQVDPDTGVPHYAEHTVKLKPEARERLTELRYTRPDGPGRQWAVALAWRVHPDHDPTASAELALGLSYNIRF
jgi:Subtilase family